MRQTATELYGFEPLTVDDRDMSGHQHYAFAVGEPVKL
jgi:hypothetical protein